MNDMSSVIVPKSDQINADDLIAGPVTVTIRAVQITGGTEQPVSISLEGTDKFFRPCKSMSRVLVANWGPDAKAYVGRSLTLYRDPKVKWGGLEVGGIRISHMSHIDAPMTMALTTTRSNRQPFTVKPLANAPRQSTAGQDDATLAVIETLRNIARGGMAQLEAGWKEIGADTRKALKNELPALKKIAEEADAADDFNTPSSAGQDTVTHDSPNAEEGADDSQRGDGDADTMAAEAEAWIQRYEAACQNEPDGKKLAAIHRDADKTAAVILGQFPDLYERLLSHVRPADAPEKAGGLFGGQG